MKVDGGVRQQAVARVGGSIPSQRRRRRSGRVLSQPGPHNSDALMDPGWLTAVVVVWDRRSWLWQVREIGGGIGGDAIDSRACERIERPWGRLGEGQGRIRPPPKYSRDRYLGARKLLLFFLLAADNASTFGCFILSSLFIISASFVIAILSTIYPNNIFFKFFVSIRVAIKKFLD